MGRLETRKGRDVLRKDRSQRATHPFPDFDRRSCQSTLVGGVPVLGLRRLILHYILLVSLVTVTSAWCGPTEQGAVVPDSADPSKLIRSLEQPARDAKARPDAVIAALGLTPGQVIGDIGAGTGYLTLRLARQVGPQGQVFAVDIEPRVLEELSRKALDEGITNIVPVLAPPDNSHLAQASCDLLLLHHVYVHLPDRVAYLNHLATRLKRGGRIAIIDWRKAGGLPGFREATSSGKALTPKQVTEELAAAGFSVLEDVHVLPQKYFLIASPRE